MEVKLQGMFGPAANNDKSIRLLNRVLTWTPGDITVKADQRHVELIVQQLDLSGDLTPLTPVNATLYRAAVAKGSFLSLDRSDIQFVVEELSRGMASPAATDQRKLKRRERYLIGRIRSQNSFKYKYGDLEDPIVNADSDYAGCKFTRKSTPGGVLTIVGHMLKSWRSAQAVIALSSGCRV